MHPARSVFVPIRTWNIQGTWYPVYRVKIDGNDEGEFDSWRGELRISEEVGASRFWNVEVHEVWHACEFEQDIERRLRDEFGFSTPVIERIRELYAGSIMPVFVDTLARNNLLTPPPPPVFTSEDASSQ